MTYAAAAAAAALLQLCPTLCDPIDGSPLGSPVPGIFQSRTQSGLPFPFPMDESEKWTWNRSVVSTLSDPMDWSLPGSSVHRIFQARVLEWVAIAFSTVSYEEEGKKNREEALFPCLQFQFQHNLFYSEMPAAPHLSSCLLDSWLNLLSQHQCGVFGNYPDLGNPAVCSHYCTWSFAFKKMRRTSWLIGGHLKPLPWEITKRILTFLNLSKLWYIFFLTVGPWFPCSYNIYFATPLTAACKAPLSMEFSRQEYWSEL